MTMASTLSSQPALKRRASTLKHGLGRTSIVAIAQRTGLTLRAIRLYEEKRLVVSMRDPQRMRWYDASMVERLNFIALARRAGLSLAEIGNLLKAGDHHERHDRASEALTLLGRKLTELELQRQAVEDCMSALGCNTFDAWTSKCAKT